jgi:hypothetical protein
MSETIELSIIVVNYNSRDLLRGCLRSIEEHARSFDPEVIVIDNASSDGSAEMVAEEFPWVTLQANKTNLGYTGGVNQGLRMCRGEFILILNADIVLQESSVAELLSFMKEHPDAGIVGPQLRFPNGELQLSCRTFYSFRTLLYRRTFLGRLFPNSKALREHMMADWDHSEPRVVDWVLGGCILVRRQALSNVGLMDERYFLYLEDVDWCYRMRQYGWKVYYNPYSVITHYYRQGSRREGRINKDLLIHILSMFHYLDKWNKFIYFAKRYLYFLKGFAYVAVDLVALNSAFVVAWAVRSLVADETEILYGPDIYFSPVLLMNISCIALFYLLGLYRPTFRASWVDELPSIVKGLLGASAIVALIMLLSEEYQSGFLYSRLGAALFLCFALVFLVIGRMVLRSFDLFLKSHRFNLKRVAIIGYGETAQRLHEQILANPQYGYEVAGFVSLEPVENNHRLGLQVLGAIESLPSILETERLQEVIFTDVHQHYRDMVHPIITCQRRMLDVKIVSGEYENHFMDPRIDYFLGLPYIHFNKRPAFYVSIVLKRVFDLVLALFLIILVSPLIAGLWALNRARGQGSLFVTENKLGQGRQPFKMYRLRSLSHDGPQGEAAPRSALAKLERFLRTHFLDEIPQLFNVLQGTMSMVGPRPVSPEEMAEAEPWHLTRFEVKPGLTGLWQIHKQIKWKFDEMVRLDIHYIQNWSLMYDLQILLRTLPLVLLGEGG